MNGQTNHGDSASRPRDKRSELRPFVDSDEVGDGADFAEEHDPSPSDPPVARLHVEYDDSFDDPTGV